MAERANKALDRKNEAEADKFASETILTELDIELAKESVAGAKYAGLFERSADFRSGFIQFNEPIDEDTAALYSATFRRWSRLHPNQPLTIELNSGGGSIIDGFALFDEIVRMRNEGHHITIRVRGNAASMACVLLQAADRREMGANAFLMIHRASFGAMGSAYEVEDSLDFVKKLEGRIVNIFTNRSGKTKKVFTDFFDKRKDIWFDAEEALKLGLVDAIV